MLSCGSSLVYCSVSHDDDCSGCSPDAGWLIPRSRDPRRPLLNTRRQGALKRRGGVVQGILKALGKILFKVCVVLVFAGPVYFLGQPFPLHGGCPSNWRDSPRPGGGAQKFLATASRSRKIKAESAGTQTSEGSRILALNSAYPLFIGGRQIALASTFPPTNVQARCAADLALGPPLQPFDPTDVRNEPTGLGRTCHIIDRKVTVLGPAGRAKAHATCPERSPRVVLLSSGQGASKDSSQAMTPIRPSFGGRTCGRVFQRLRRIINPP